MYNCVLIIESTCTYKWTQVKKLFTLKKLCKTKIQKNQLRSSVLLCRTITKSKEIFI